MWFATSYATEVKRFYWIDGYCVQRNSYVYNKVGFFNVLSYLVNTVLANGLNGTYRRKTLVLEREDTGEPTRRQLLNITDSFGTWASLSDYEFTILSDAIYSQRLSDFYDWVESNVDYFDRNRLLDSPDYLSHGLASDTTNIVCNLFYGITMRGIGLSNLG